MRRFLKALTIVSALLGSVLCDPTLALDKYVTPAGGGLLDGSSWDNAYSNIQDAVNACTTAGDAIYLKYGVYTNLSQIGITNRPGLTIRGGYEGVGTPGGFTNAPSAITRDLSVSNRIFYCTVSTVTLDRVTITNGYITSGNGGGLYLTNCQTVLTNCTLENNMATNNGMKGGAIYASGGTLTINGCLLRNNRFSNSGAHISGSGGGIYASGVDVTLSTVTLERNYAYGYEFACGGGVYLSGGRALISDCTFRTNYCSGRGAGPTYYTYGGAVYATGVNPLTISNCFFTRNYLIGRSSLGMVNGGVMYLTGVAMEMADCEITENSGGSMVENVYINTTNWVSFRDSIFTGGSGNNIYQTGSGSLSLTNCLIHSNPGHALLVNTGTVTLANCTLAGNVGWGLNSPSSAVVTVRDSIAWENTAGGITTNGNVTVSYTCSQEPIAGTGNLSVDPRFISQYYLSVNGLPYQGTNSPCIDAGSATASALGLDTRTTRTDGMNDSGQADLGYHATNGVPGITNLVLYVDVVNGSDANNGWTPGTALKTITAGLSNAIDGSTINIATGAYNPAAGERFPLTLQDVNLTLKGTNQVSTVVDAGATARVLEVFSKGRVWLEGLTITNGSSGSSSGGGLYLSGCQSVMTNCILENNMATNDGAKGGAVYASGGMLTVADSVLRNNRFYNSGAGIAGNGGGIYADGVDVTLSTVILDGNYAYGYEFACGGGVYLSGGSALISGCTFRTNYCSDRGAGDSYYTYGGAVYANGVTPLTVSNCFFTRNYLLKRGSLGMVNGAVMYVTGGATTMSDCEISENSSGTLAETVYINVTDSVSIEKTFITGGSSNGIYKIGSGSLSLTNCLIASNPGHGLLVNTGSVTVVNCTLARNTDWGLNSPSSAVVTVWNCIAWWNTNGGFSANCALTYTDSQEAHDGAGNLNVDPVFVGVASNDYRLSLSSPCVNTGTNEAWMVNTTDLVGERRIRMGRVDMGPYEAMPPKGTVFGIRGQ